jgi:thiol-disulfide isomerase/thioredoxin
MNKVIAMIAICLVLFGCNEQQNMAGLSEDNQNKSTQTEYVNTSGLSFEREVDEELTNLDVPPPEIPEFDFSNTTTEDGRLIVYYFYMARCSACIATEPKIDELEAEYPDAVFLRYDIGTTNGSYAYKDFAAQYGLNKSQMYVPQVLVNGMIITDMFNINESLEGVIAEY